MRMPVSLLCASIFLLCTPGLAGAVEESSDEPLPGTPSASTGTTPGDGGFYTGVSESGDEGDTDTDTDAGDTASVSTTAQGTWSKVGQACAIGGVGTCTTFVICPTGERADYWIKTVEGEVVDQAVACPGEDLPDDTTTTTTPAIDPRAELKKVLLPEAVITVQPPDGETLVNLPTIFSTDARTYTAPPLKVLDSTVVFTLTPQSFVWHHGDGTTQTTTTGGKRFVDGDEPTALIHHAYARTAQDVPVSVDITWSATWTLDGKAQGAVDGTVTKVGQAQHLDVLEATPTLVR